MSDTLTKKELAEMIRQYFPENMGQCEVLWTHLRDLANNLDSPEPPKPKFKPGDVVAVDNGWLRFVNADDQLEFAGGSLCDSGNDEARQATDGEIRKFFCSTSQALPRIIRQLVEKAYGAPCT